MTPLVVISMRARSAVAEAAALTALTPCAGQDPVTAFAAALWAPVLGGVS